MSKNISNDLCMYAKCLESDEFDSASGDSLVVSVQIYFK